MPTAKERAVTRIFDALERGQEASKRDLKRAGVCLSCYGFGYYYSCDDLDEKITCRTCGGDGIPKKTK